MTVSQLIFVKKIMQGVDAVLIYAGAGMSVEIGNVPYWSGEDSRYGGEVTKYGFTPVEHATEAAWFVSPERQQLYVNDLRENFLNNLNSSSVNLYTELLKTIEACGLDYHVVTSNVDNAFAFYGFDPDRIYEKHGNYFYVQCSNQHEQLVTEWDKNVANCDVCGFALRPNVLMFEDSNFSDVREVQQWFAYDNHLKELVMGGKKVLLLEVGVGTTVLNIRDMAVKAHYVLHSSPLIHINPVKDDVNNYSKLAALRNFPVPVGKEIWVLDSGSDFAEVLRQ